MSQLYARQKTGKIIDAKNSINIIHYGTTTQMQKSAKLNKPPVYVSKPQANKISEVVKIYAAATLLNGLKKHSAYLSTKIILHTLKEWQNVLNK